MPGAWSPSPRAQSEEEDTSIRSSSIVEHEKSVPLMITTDDAFQNYDAAQTTTRSHHDGDVSRARAARGAAREMAETNKPAPQAGVPNGPRKLTNAEEEPTKEEEEEAAVKAAAARSPASRGGRGEREGGWRRGGREERRRLRPDPRRSRGERLSVATRFLRRPQRRSSADARPASAFATRLVAGERALFVVERIALRSVSGAPVACPLQPLHNVPLRRSPREMHARRARALGSSAAVASPRGVWRGLLRHASAEKAGMWLPGTPDALGRCPGRAQPLRGSLVPNVARREPRRYWRTRERRRRRRLVLARMVRLTRTGRPRR